MTAQTELTVINNDNPLVSFEKERVDEYLKKLRERELSVVGDISTDAGRKELASRAYKIAQQKNDVKRAAEKLKEDHQKVIKEINREQSRIWDEMETIQHEVRKPLTEWENAEKDRVAGHETALRFISVDLVNLNPDDAPELFEKNMNELAHYEERDWQEFNIRADMTIKQTREFLTKGYNRRIKEIADAAELAELRRKQAEQEQKDRDAKIAADAAAKAKQEAEEKAEREKEEIELQKKAAEERAQKAEADRIAAEKKAEADKQAALEKAKADADAAAKREREKIAAEQKAEDDAAASREADKKHKAKINNEIKTAILAAAKISDEDAKAIIIALASGKIPHVKISY